MANEEINYKTEAEHSLHLANISNSDSAAQIHALTAIGYALLSIAELLTDPINQPAQHG